MAFDVEGARKAGYSDAEIADHLAKQSKFDSAGARKAGYSDTEIIQHLSSAAPSTPVAAAVPKPAAQQAPQGDGSISIPVAGPLGILANLLQYAPTREGMLRGAAGIGNTLLTPVRAAANALAPEETTVKTLVTGQKERSGPLAPVANYLNSIAPAMGELDAANKDHPIAYGGTKLATEIGMTYPVGGVLGQGAKAVGLERLGNALASGGMTTGAPAATTLGGKAADMAIRMTGGAVTGGASAGLVDPSQARSGAVVGAVLPPAIAGIGAAGQAVGSAVRKVTPVFSDAAANRAATGRVAGAIGEDGLSQAIGDLQTYYPKGAENIPVSSAGVTGNAGVARLEQGSRVRTPEQWTGFDQAQGKAVFDNVLSATSDAADLAARKAERAANWQEAWQKAAANQKPRLWVQRMGQLGSDIETALKSPEASNPDVRRTLEQLRDEVIRVGQDFSPAHLQQIRANLNGKVQPMSPDAFKSAPRDNPAIISLKQELDDILNVSTGGKWQKVLEGYAKDSGAVREAAAASKVRGAFVDADTGRILGRTLDSAGEVPVITDAGLSRAMNAARLPDKSLALSPDANARLEATIDALRRQAIVQNVKRSASAGGGSDTMSNLTSVIGSGHTQGGNLLLQTLGAISKAGTAKTDRAMANLLQDPDALAAALNLLSQRQANAVPLNALAAPIYRSAPVIAADR